MSKIKYPSEKVLILAKANAFEALRVINKHWEAGNILKMNKAIDYAIDWINKETEEERISRIEIIEKEEDEAFESIDKYKNLVNNINNAILSTKEDVKAMDFNGMHDTDIESFCLNLIGRFENNIKKEDDKELLK